MKRIIFYALLLFFPFLTDAQSRDRKNVRLPNSGRKGLMIASEEDIKSFEGTKRYALIVGVNGYKNLNKLSFAVGDSLKMKLTLEQIGKFNKVVLLNDESGEKDPSLLPTRVNIEREFKSMIKDHPKLLLFYFSGHGFMNSAGENVIAPMDVIYESKKNVSNYLSIHQLVKSASVLDQAVFLIDACREKLTDNTKSVEADKYGDFPENVRNAKGVAIMMGTKPGGFSYENPKLGSGTFTHFLIEGMNGGVQDDGLEYVTFGKLKEYVESHMGEYTKKETNKKQTPYTAGDYTGNFLLAVGRPKGEVKSQTVKYQDKSKNVRLARVLKDTSGKKISQNFFVISGSDTYVPADLEGVAKMKFEYDSSGYNARQYSLKGELLFEYGFNYKDEYSSVLKMLDENSLPVIKTFHRESDKITQTLSDKTGNPAEDSSGIHKTVYMHDGKNIISETYYDLSGKPADNKFKIHKKIYQYDSAGRKISEEFRNLNDQLTEDRDRYGTAKYKYTYDDAGNLILEEYLSMAGSPVRNRIAQKKYRYGRDGKLLSREFRDSSGSLKEDSSGTAALEIEYNDRRDWVKEIYRDGSGKEKSGGLSRKVRTYSPEGYLISEEFFNASGKYFEDRYYKISKYLYEYNSEGKRVSEKYFNAKQNRISDASGVFEKTYQYDAEGRLAREEFRNEKGELLRDGTAVKLYSYDSAGRKILEEFQDSTGNRKNDALGISVKKYFYAPEGLPVSVEHYSAAETPAEDGTRTAKYVFAYDSMKRKILEEHFNSSGTLIESEYNMYFPNHFLKNDKPVKVRLDKFMRPWELKFYGE
ncbi:MAG TPA: caspase family protein [Leptospiraceae bacterium]|nr:caspase family protein [Leptospiraceae bacterium]